MGREPQRVTKHFEMFDYSHKKMLVKELEVELFTWEKLDKVEAVKNAFGL
jgi:S-adenosylmethionine synthetase